jgi:hypothetical protein
MLLTCAQASGYCLCLYNVQCWETGQHVSALASFKLLENKLDPTSSMHKTLANLVIALVPPSTIPCHSCRLLLCNAPHQGGGREEETLPLSEESLLASMELSSLTLHPPPYLSNPERWVPHPLPRAAYLCTSCWKLLIFVQCSMLGYRSTCKCFGFLYNVSK